MSEDFDERWTELTPGALGRLAIHENPEECARDLMVWSAPNARTLGSWFRAVADALEGGQP